MIKVFRSEQFGTPVHTREPGTTIPVLDACLVDGFNTRSVSSLVVEDNIATVTTTTDHNYEVHDILVFSGANQSQFNNEFKVKQVLATDQFTFDITTADITATGTITCKIAPLGWEKSYSGTQLAAYRSSDAEATRHYLRVDDTTNQWAMVSMWENMTSINHGLNPTANVIWLRSNETTGTARREWTLIGDSKRFYWLPRVSGTSTINMYHHILFFGDIIPFKSNDAFHCAIAGQTSVQAIPSINTGFGYMNGTSTGCWMTRSYTQLGNAVAFNNQGFPRITFLGLGINNNAVRLNEPDFAWHLFPVYCCDGLFLRGIVPGLLNAYEYTQTPFTIPNYTRIKIGQKEIMALETTTSVSANNSFNFFISLDESDWNGLPVGSYSINIGGLQS